MVFVMVFLLISNSPQSYATPQQAQSYLDAAKAAEEAADDHDILWKVWAGVGAICTGVCVSSIAGSTLFTAGSDQMICSGSYIAGSLAEAAVTQDFTNAMMGLMMGAMGMAMQSGVEAGKASTQSKAMACLSAAMAMVQVFTKVSAADKERESAKANRKMAKELIAKQGGAATPPALVALGRGASNSAVAGGGAVTGGVGDSVGGVEKPNRPLGDGNCIQARASKEAESVLKCAFSSDSELPPYTPSNFMSDFQKASGGTSFGDFMENASDKVSEAVTQASAGVLPQEQVAPFKALLEEYQDKFAQSPNVSGAAYAGGGRGGGSGSKGSAINPQALVEKIMGQLMPKAKTEADSGLPGTIRFSGSRRTATINPEDPTVNIFERVSERYQIVYRRWVLQ